MRTVKDERLFNVDQVTHNGITRLASLVSADESREHIAAARRARAPGVCTRRYLATRETVPKARLPHSIEVPKRKGLTPAQRAAIMAEAEVCE